MSNPVKNSHTIQRRLTEPWEYTKGSWKRQLRYYDFETDRVESLSSKKLLTAETPFPQAVEDALNRYVETPLASHLHATSDGTELQPEVPWTLRRAMLLSILLQAARTSAGQGDAESLKFLTDAATWDAPKWDEIAIAAAEDFHVVGCIVPPSYALYFAGVGISLLPLSGSLGAPFQATSPGSFIAAIPAAIPEQVAGRTVLELINSGSVVALSVGLTARRVVVPPQLANVSDAEIRTRVRSLRDASRRLTQLTKLASEVAGLDAVGR